MARVRGDALLLPGRGASPAGDLPFLDRLELATFTTTRLWRCDPGHYEEVTEALDDAGTRLLTRHETPDEPANYRIRTLGEKATIAPVTSFADPTPELRGVKKQEKDQVHVKYEPRARVHQHDDAVWKLVNRPVLAYRNRRVLDIAASDLGKVEIQREGEAFTFEKKDGSWKLTAPVNAEVDAGKTEALTLDLGRLEGVDFIADQPKAEDLDKEYGLAKPALTVTGTSLFGRPARPPRNGDRSGNIAPGGMLAVSLSV